MATIKAYTDISQSKTLAKILPIESADMQWVIDGLGEPFPFSVGKDRVNESEEPCWSLAALLSVLPLPDLIQDKADDELFWQCCVYEEDGTLIYETYDHNPVDACVEMIESLHELKML